ncbi:hypothetical protein BU17DRAFT_61066 [Hysterangium stoloniferum]|nr:hypothetical protein BU17DRAFT_61066 [Hysterangium stoloniferum]
MAAYVVRHPLTPGILKDVQNNCIAAKYITRLLIFVLLSEEGTAAVLPNPLLGVFPGCFPTHFNGTVTLLDGGLTTAFQGMLSPRISYREVLISLRDGAMYCLIISVMYLVNVVTFKYGVLLKMVDSSHKHLDFVTKGQPFGAEPPGKLDHVRS